VQIERAKNQIIVGEADELESIEFMAKGVNWVAFDAPDEPVRARVKVRYRHDPSPATIYALPDAQARIVFDEPQRAITPGQATIFYDIDECDEGGRRRLDHPLVNFEIHMANAKKAPEQNGEGGKKIVGIFKAAGGKNGT
jgi:hypothetical protein